MDVLYLPIEESSGGQAAVAARVAPAARESPLVNERYHGPLTRFKGAARERYHKVLCLVFTQTGSFSHLCFALVPTTTRPRTATRAGGPGPGDLGSLSALAGGNSAPDRTGRSNRVTVTPSASPISCLLSRGPHSGIDNTSDSAFTPVRTGVMARHHTGKSQQGQTSLLG